MSGEVTEEVLSIARAMVLEELRQEKLARRRMAKPWEPEHFRSDTYAQINAMQEAGMTAAQVAHKLNEMGVRPKLAPYWSATTVANVTFKYRKRHGLAKLPAYRGGSRRSCPPATAPMQATTDDSTKQILAQMHSEGLGPTAMAKVLNGQGITTAYGLPWNANRLRHALDAICADG